jgi:Rod binding domain-containing protein
VSLIPDLTAQASLAADATNASKAQALAARLGPAKAQQAPAKAFGKILESLTPEKAQAAGMPEDALKTLTMQAQNRHFAPGPSKEAKLREACQGFESVFVGQMLKEMRKSVPKDGILDGKTEEQYVGMFDDELAKTLTKQGGIGLTSFMMRQLQAQADAKNPKPGPDSQKGLRRSASGSLVTSAMGIQPMHGLREKALNPLRAGGLKHGPEVVQAVGAASPGTPGKDPAFQGRPQAGPGAQYLQNADPASDPVSAERADIATQEDTL